MNPPSQTIYSADDVEITYIPGQTDNAVVVFTGIGLGLGGLQIPEFRRTLSGTTHHTYFVIEQARYWYNSTFERIVSALNVSLEQVGIHRVVTLGNSMGGFGAIVFAKRLQHCVRAIAFAPQSAMDPAIVPWDGRFRDLTVSVQRWNGLDATLELTPSIEYFLFFGTRTPEDTRHVERFSAACSLMMSVYLIDDAGHGVAIELAHKGVLKGLTNALINAPDPHPEVGDALRDVPHRIIYGGHDR